MTHEYDDLAKLADLLIANAGKPPFEIARAAFDAGYRPPAWCGDPRMDRCGGACDNDE